MDPVAPAPSESTRKGSSQHQFQTSNPGEEEWTLLYKSCTWLTDLEVGLTPSQEELLTRATLASIEDVISHINTRTHRHSPARPQTDASSQTHTTPGKNAESDDDAIFVDASQAGTVQHLRLPHHLRLIYHLSHGDCGASEKRSASIISLIDSVRRAREPASPSKLRISLYKASPHCRKNCQNGH